MKMCVWELFLMAKIWFKNSTHTHTLAQEKEKRRMKEESDGEIDRFGVAKCDIMYDIYTRATQSHLV